MNICLWMGGEKMIIYENKGGGGDGKAENSEKCHFIFKIYTPG